MDTVPDATTLIKLNQRFGEERMTELNRLPSALCPLGLENLHTDYNYRNVRKVRMFALSRWQAGPEMSPEHRGANIRNVAARLYLRINHSFGSFTDVLAEAMYDHARRVKSNCRPVHKMSAPRPLARDVGAESTP